ncbi:MAG: TSUP family transporter [Bacteroidia bacterium]|nr:TSUP family transporter [Bacteroidia bacterium]
MSDVLTYTLLLAAGFFGGLVDSMAGGGGLITLPSLIAAGLPPHVALASNKVQSAIGTTVSTWRYLRSGWVLPLLGVIGFASAFAGSWSGARVVMLIPASSLEAVIPFLIVVVAAITFLRKDFGVHEREPHIGVREYAIAAVFAFALGFYDGFFGPGTGSFLAFGFVLVFRFGFLRATAHAKLLNLASNYAAILAFVFVVDIEWGVAVPMGLANIAGAWTGAGLAIKGGSKVIKPVFGLVLLALLVRLLW